MERAAKRGKGNQGQAVPRACKKQAGGGGSKMGSLQRLREAADSMGWSVGETLTRTGGSDHSPSFRCDLRLCGRAVASEAGGSKQDAKERAATSALNTITSEPTSPFADKVAEMVLNRWSELSSKEQRRSLSRTVVAGIVMERERELDPHGYYVQGEGGGQNMRNDYEVIALGAGTAHRASAEVSERPAPALNDCHAEILSRRAFVKFLYCELTKAQEESDIDSIFHRPAPNKTNFVLKSGIRFHLYISVAPCGDASCCLGSGRCLYVIFSFPPPFSPLSTPALPPPPL
eukprot:Tamp_04316.p1 GENE.Tamp_04316~~Tamp_04316.p1  ORF type:complete len:289 (+),score=50.02 Tamp_04316:564-1430(+)